MIHDDRADGNRPQRIDVATVDERLRALDGLRGIAIAAVLLYHFGWAWSLPVDLYGYGHRSWSVLGLGRLGVQFFFMISGFVILMTLQRSGGVCEFAQRRFARIYPAFCVACIASFTVTHEFGPVQLKSAPRDLLFGLALLPPPWFHGRFVDTAFWSLIVEAQFYLAVAPVYFASPRRLAPGWILALVLMLTAWLVIPGGRSPLSLASHAAFFTAGMSFYFQFSGRAGAGLLMAASVAGYVVTCRTFTLAEHGVVAAMFVVFALVSARAARIFSASPLVFLGTISYALYLVHQNLGLILIHAATSAGLSGWLAALLASVACVTLAYLVTHGIEAPAKRWLVGRRTG